MSSTQSARQSVGERVHELVAEGERRLESLDQGADPADVFDDLASEAGELIDETDPRTLLAAIGGGEHGDDPGSFPEAMAQSDPETVIVLRKLLLLAEIDDGSIAESVETFRKLSDVGSEQSEPDDRGDESESAEGEDVETEDGSTAGDEATDTLQLALREGIDEFRDGIERMRSELQDAEESSSDEAEDESSGAKPTGGTMFSTMPSSDRPDMRKPSRLSTVRSTGNEDLR